MKIFFLTAFLFELVVFGFILTLGNTAAAADPIELKMQVGIPGAEKGFGPGESYSFSDNSTKPIAQYIRSIYKYAIGIVGILATVVMMIGGIMWIMSGGSPERAGEAKAWISASLTGLILAICSYLILATVNPALTNFNITAVPDISKITTGCCETSLIDAGGEQENQCKMVTQKDCDGGVWKGEGLACQSDGTCGKPNLSSINCQFAADPCKMPDGSDGYCGFTKSEVCYKLIASGKECSGFGRNYECVSKNCDYGLAGCSGSFCCR